MGEWVCLVDEKLVARELESKEYVCTLVWKAVRSLVILLSGVSLDEGSTFYAFKFILGVFFFGSQ